jgi:hypothetical protein
VRWLHAIDPAFAEQKIIPLFDWSLDEKRAEQSWHGFLVWGHWSPFLVNKLMSGFIDTVRRLASQNSEGSDSMGIRIAEHVAWLSVRWVSDPLAGDWLLSCIRSMAADNRSSFARQVREQLQGMPPEEIANLWDAWLSKYWTARAHGLPPLDANEARTMFSWATFPHKHTPAVVALALPLAHIAKFTHSDIANELNESQMANFYPFEAAQLLLACLQSSPEWFQADEDCKQLWTKLVDARIPTPLLEDIRGHLIRLGGTLENFLMQPAG